MNHLMTEPQKTESATVHTKDLWKSAFILSEGGWLVGTKLARIKGKKEFTFKFRNNGVNVEQLDKLFQSGQAKCSVTHLKASLIHLREIMRIEEEKIELTR